MAASLNTKPTTMAAPLRSPTKEKPLRNLRPMTMAIIAFIAIARPAPTCPTLWALMALALSIRYTTMALLISCAIPTSCHAKPTPRKRMAAQNVWTPIGVANTTISVWPSTRLPATSITSLRMMAIATGMPT